MQSMNMTHPFICLEMCWSIKRILQFQSIQDLNQVTVWWIKPPHKCFSLFILNKLIKTQVLYWVRRWGVENQGKALDHIIKQL